MSISNFKVVGLTLAVTNMDKMVRFYSEMFGLQFQQDNNLSNKLGADFYRTSFGELPVLFCPNSVAGVDAQQNRQQWDIEVAELEPFFSGRLTALEGKIKTEPYKDGDHQVGAILDPDGNTVVLKQAISAPMNDDR